MLKNIFGILCKLKSNKLNVINKPLTLIIALVACLLVNSKLKSANFSQLKGTSLK